MLARARVLALLTLAPLSAFAADIADVTICAAECRSESLGILGPDLAEVGVIHYASASAANLAGTAACLADARTAKLYSDRLEKDFLPLCAEALLGKYSGKVVTLRTEKIGEILGGFTGEPIPAVGVTKITESKR